MLIVLGAMCMELRVTWSKQRNAIAEVHCKQLYARAAVRAAAHRRPWRPFWRPF
jgi:hypothetical protein